MGRIASFRYVRAQVCRLDHGRTWHAGWTEHLVPDSARILLQAPVRLQARETVLVVAFGDGASARLVGYVVAQAGAEVVVEAHGRLTYGPSKEDVRLRLDRLAGSIQAGKRGGHLLAMDASPQSLGVVTDAGFAPGAIVDFALATPLGFVEAQAGVVNCSPEPTGGHRLGLRILDASRLDLALWGRMLRERGEH